MASATKTPRTGRPRSAAVPPCERCGDPGGAIDKRYERPMRCRADRVGFPGLTCRKCFNSLDSKWRIANGPKYDVTHDPDADLRPIPPDPSDDARLAALIDSYPWGVAITAATAAATWGMTEVEAWEVVGRLLVREPGACCPIRRVVATAAVRNDEHGPERETRVYRVVSARR